jgi:hypothetical protein
LKHIVSIVLKILINDLRYSLEQPPEVR